MLTIFYICIALFVLKLSWNLFIPIIITFFWSQSDRDNRGMSLAPVELIILVLITVLSWVYDLSVFSIKGFWLFAIGLGVIIFTYIFIFLFLKIFKNRFSAPKK